MNLVMNLIAQGRFRISRTLYVSVLRLKSVMGNFRQQQLTCPKIYYKGLVESSPKCPYIQVFGNPSMIGAILCVTYDRI